MELVTCSWDAKKASLTKSFVGGRDVIKLGSKKFTLPDDIEKTKVTSEQNEMTGGRMLLIILLAITIIGLLTCHPTIFCW